MTNQDNKNFVETLVDAQKQAMDTMVENTKKLANGHPAVSETVEKGTEWYKNWLEDQKNIFSKTTGKSADMAGNMKNNINQMNEFYQNWFQTQMNSARQMWEMNSKQFQDAANKNPVNAFQEMQQNWTNWINAANNTSQWMNMMQQWTKMFNMDAHKHTAENWSGLYQQYQEILNSNWAKLQENMQQGTARDAYKNMVNATESFAKFYEMWQPMWKSIQEKTFNMDVYKQWMNPVAYKDLMDKFLGFMPEGNRTYLNQMSGMMREGMKQMNAMGMGQYHQMRDMMGNMMPGMNSAEVFGNMLNGYNQYAALLNNASAPFTKMMTPNQHTKTLMEWQDIANRMAVYNIKNAELQYLMYAQGTQVMDKLAENIAQKIAGGEEISSIMALFQEWMSISDKTFVSLFESDEYSKLMAEVSAMQIKLKKDVEKQMEKMMTGIPVATRSEMDELYKTIYDLKKQVRQLEKMMDIDQDEESAAASKTAAKSRATKK